MRSIRLVMLSVLLSSLAPAARAAQGPVDLDTPSSLALPASESAAAPASPDLLLEDLPDGATGFAVVAGRVLPLFAERAPDAEPSPPPPREAATSGPPARAPRVPISSGRADVDRLVRDAAARYRLDPALITAVMRQESGFNPRAVSRAGASGLMQLMPATARRFGVTDVFDPAQNVDAGARYLRVLLDLFDGDLALALAGYNAGEGRVLAAGRRIPAITETREYVAAILARYRAARAGALGTPPSEKGRP